MAQLVARNVLINNVQPELQCKFSLPSRSLELIGISDGVVDIKIVVERDQFDIIRNGGKFLVLLITKLR